MGLKKCVRLIYWKITGNTFIYSLKKELLGCETVLDLGCGLNSPIQYCKIPYSVGVETFGPYLNKSKIESIHNKYINQDVRSVEFPERSFDAILILDVIEHMAKNDGLELIKKMEKWAKKKIIVSTPNGFLAQNEEIDNNISAKHISGWDIKDFKDLGFNRIFGISGLKKLREDNVSKKLKPVFFWRILSDFSQRIAHNHPDKAFGLLVVKDL